MSERKVLNKYYPPDFDPAKIPKLRLPRNRQYSIRIMAPFNMRCNTCGEYIYKGKKFNSRKETVENENYLGLHIFRFYIKCPRCVAEIAFKTDPHNTDYALEDGATRNFEANRTAEILAEKDRKEKEAEETNNPMKVLENRTKQSRQEMEMLETLEDLKELRTRHAGVDREGMLDLYTAYEEQLKRLQEEEDEQFIKSAFVKDEDNIKRLAVDQDDEEDTVRRKIAKVDKPTDFLASTEDSEETGEKKPDLTSVKKPAAQKKGSSLVASQSKLGMFIKKKPATATVNSDAQKDKTTAKENGEQSNSEKIVNSGLAVSSSSVGTGSATEAENKTVKASGSGVSEGPKPPVSGLGLLGAYGQNSSDSDSE
eukprot:GHVU01018954.1.p1 GENE.GHVU01018954.1~~GHVU01018954.1.p1  ORF type:complete len:368 (+),score=75.79 GHVU01018954.1:90-1193(+)